MFYRYNENYIIIEKSETELLGDNVVTYNGDIDIQLFDVVVGFIGPNREMLRHTKILRSVENITNVLNNLKSEINPSIDINTCTLEELKTWQINLSKSNLENYFNSNPITSSCHQNIEKLYSISREKQTLLTQMIMMTQMAAQFGIVYQPSWNSTGEACTYDWTLNELRLLAFEVEQVVRPKVSAQQKMETEINAATTKDEILAIPVYFI
jgi:hypothetical protein